MSLHKSERGESKFEVLDHAVILKKTIRELDLVRNYGYKIRESKIPKNFSEWSETSQEHWKANEAARLERLKMIDAKFLDAKRKVIEGDLTRLMHGIDAANTIVRPTRMVECDMRLQQQDIAIAACHDLLIDLQDIMDTLPIDKNWMTQVEPQIQKQIALLKAWKKSDAPIRSAVKSKEDELLLQTVYDNLHEILLRIFNEPLDHY